MDSSGGDDWNCVLRLIDFEKVKSSRIHGTIQGRATLSLRLMDQATEDDGVDGEDDEHAATRNIQRKKRADDLTFFCRTLISLEIRVTTTDNMAFWIVYRVCEAAY